MLRSIHLPLEKIRGNHLVRFRFLDTVSSRYIQAHRVWVKSNVLYRGAGLMLLFDDKTHPAVIAVCVAISGIGIGFTFQPTLVALQAHCTKSQRAVSLHTCTRSTAAGRGPAVLTPKDWCKTLRFPIRRPLLPRGTRHRYAMLAWYLAEPDGSS